MLPTADSSDREILLSRIFAAPRDLVFAAFTQPRYIGHWWGPRGFTTTIQTMDVRPGGLWTFVMHGPDGTDYPNWIRYLAVERPDRLVYDHGGGSTDTPAHFQVTVDFIPQDGGTEVVMRSVFPTAAARDEVVQRYGAIEGGQQTLARLGEHLAVMAVECVQAGRIYRFSRRFAAPLDLVFQAWTDPAHLVHWWGPFGFTSPTCIFEARPGGRIHIDMQGPDGTVMPMTGTVQEISPPHLLAFTCTIPAADGGVAFEGLNTIRLTHADGCTTVDVEASFTTMNEVGIHRTDDMDVGWTQSLERLEDQVLNPDAMRHPERDILTMRHLQWPRDRVFAAWTDPEQLHKWWGPKGFASTWAAFDLHPGGDWRFTMRAPDGQTFANHCRFLEIRPPELLAFAHLDPTHAFTVRASFYAWNGGTLVAFRMRFADSGECERVRSIIVTANEQNFDRLEAVLAGRDPG